MPKIVLILLICLTSALFMLGAVAVRPFEGRVVHNRDWTPRTAVINGIDVVYVPAGCFLMGADPSLSVKLPQHPQCVDEPFWIGRHEVSYGQYRACFTAGICGRPRVPLGLARQPDDHPVVNIQWHNARTYALWVGGRLPTEREWEYAARGPDSLAYPWGEQFDGARLNACDAACTMPRYVATLIEDGYAETAPVGSFPGDISWVGALDMGGNVREWTHSLYIGYPYHAGDGREAVFDITSDRAVRGGSWSALALDARTDFRRPTGASHQSGDTGFRVVFAAQN